MPEQDIAIPPQLELADDTTFDLEAIAANYEGEFDLIPLPRIHSKAL